MPQPPDAIDAAFTVSAEGVPGANQITIGVALKKYNVALDVRHIIHAWLSSDAAGDTIAADPGTLAAGTNGTMVVEPLDDIVAMFLTEANGTLDVVITHASTSGFYLNLALPGGRVVTSPIAQFA
jgi:hypothetical protein